MSLDPKEPEQPIKRKRKKRPKTKRKFVAKCLSIRELKDVIARLEREGKEYTTKQIYRATMVYEVVPIMER